MRDWVIMPGGTPASREKKWREGEADAFRSIQMLAKSIFVFAPPSGMHSYMQMEMQCMPKKTYCTRLLDHTAKLVAQR
jgi:hypothetical protein